MIVRHQLSCPNLFRSYRPFTLFKSWAPVVSLCTPCYSHFLSQYTSGSYFTYFLLCLFIGDLITSQQALGGRMEPCLNLSSWIPLILSILISGMNHIAIQRSTIKEPIAQSSKCTASRIKWQLHPAASPHDARCLVPQTPPSHFSFLPMLVLFNNSGINPVDYHSWNVLDHPC